MIKDSHMQTKGNKYHYLLHIRTPEEISECFSRASIQALGSMKLATQNKCKADKVDLINSTLPT